MRRHIPSVADLCVALALALPAGAWAQSIALAAGQLSGAELQAWLDKDGLAVVGFDLKGRCQFLALNRGADRHLSVFCPSDAAPWVVKGQGKVVGNSWCVKYTYPNGTSTDHCEEFFRIADDRYEIRRDGVAVNRVLRFAP